MLLNYKVFEEINKSDIEKLVADKVPEGKDIDYKSALPRNTDSANREFLYDVSSFANSSGGYIIFGMEESDGIPTNINGLSGIDPDAEILRLQSIVLSGIEPRIFGFTIRKIDISASSFVLIAKVPRSWNFPHMVKIQGLQKFYSRHSNGKYQLDVNELKTLFNISGTIATRIRQFQAERMSKIIADETPVKLAHEPRIILHLIPFNAFEQSINYDYSNIKPDEIARVCPQLYTATNNYRYNIDGIATFCGSIEKECASYTQLFRNGIIESVDASLLSFHEGKIIPSEAYEKCIIEKLPIYLSLIQKYGASFPLVIIITLVGVEGYSMGLSPMRFPSTEKHSIDRDILVLPETLIEKNEKDYFGIMRPVFDTLWNAAGFEKSLNYNEKGEWTGQGGY